MWYLLFPYSVQRSVVLFALVAFVSCSGNLSQIILFEDEFDRLPVGYISEDVSCSQYHFRAGTGQQGMWMVSASGRSNAYNTAWEIMAGEDGNHLRQNFYGVDEDLNPLKRHVHPLIVAGDSIWHDYKVEFSFRPDEVMDKCGVVFRYQDSRNYYFYGMEGNRLVLKMRAQATAPHRPFEKVLASAPFNWQPGSVYKGEVSIKQNRIYTLLNDSLSLVAEDVTFARGKVGFLSDIPADFLNMKVTTLKREQRKMSRYKEKLSGARAIRINENANPVIWKKADLGNHGAGRNIRFGDINSDGKMELLTAQVDKTDEAGGGYGIGCLTAMNFDGEVLWQRGTPRSTKIHCEEEAAFQIHDLDGDGNKEVVYAVRGIIYVLDGKKGRLLRRKTLSEGQIAAGKYTQINATRIFFCDLQGKGRDSDLLVLARSGFVWACDEHLNLLWTHLCKPGKSYPSAMDVDGDGRDEVLIGYSLIDDDGSEIWNRASDSGDEATAVAIASLNQPSDSALRMLFGAGDWGTMVYNKEGELLLHNPIGYVQSITIANLRSDLPGPEMVSSNFWGSQGIICLYDANGQIYRSFEPGSHGSMCLPVNWRGDGVEYFLLNTSAGDGGLFNGRGLLSVSFPDDDHPELCNAVLDVYGDTRDEIITWNQHELWVYTQSDNPRQGRVFQSERNPLYNYSNYRVNVSTMRRTE
ncbi:MAG: hypothetical protein K9G38_03775 [Bacteroidales bacterium]|nr:hypothetical protein [Bacteroidales bacterium]